MRKIKLHLESLAVESFDTTRTEPDPGTVAGHQVTAHPCVYVSGTCLESCYGTCDRSCSCNGTCVSCLQTCGFSCPGPCTLPPGDTRNLENSCAVGLC